MSDCGERYDPATCQDAYVFVSSGSAKTIGALKQLWRDGHVRYVARLLSGAHGAVAFVEVAKGPDALANLRDKLTLIRDAVNPSTSVGMALETGPMAPTRWSEKKPVGAYVRIRAQKGLAKRLFDDLNQRDGEGGYALKGYFGSALVLGDWDVLLELGADTLEEMEQQLLEVNAFDAVVSTDSAIVINDRYEPAAPDNQ